MESGVRFGPQPLSTNKKIQKIRQAASVRLKVKRFFVAEVESMVDLDVTFMDPVVKGRLRASSLSYSTWQDKQRNLHFCGGQTAVMACEIHGEFAVFVPPDGLGGFGQDEHVADPRHKFA